jgi:hypothetical protein
MQLLDIYQQDAVARILYTTVVHNKLHAFFAGVETSMIKQLGLDAYIP